MIQLISGLPFDISRISELKNDWSRFQDGKVIFSEIPDAICAEFVCEAEIIPQVEEEERESSTSLDPNGEAEEDEDSSSNSKLFNELVNNLPAGKGKLILSASKLYWIKEGEEKPVGWSIDYKNVILHAISKPDSESPHLYLQLSCNRFFNADGHEISFVEADEDEKFVEVKLIVEDEAVVDEMFVSLSECAALHPCDDDENEEDFSDFSDSEEPPNKLGKVDPRFEDAAEN